MIGKDGLLLLLLSRLENLEGAQETLIDRHHGSSIIELATVVWSREERHELAFGEKLVSVLHDLVGTAYEVHVMLLQESGDDVRAEGEGDTAIVFAPPSDVFVWIRPEQVAQKTAVRNLVPC